MHLISGVLQGDESVSSSAAEEKVEGKRIKDSHKENLFANKYSSSRCAALHALHDSSNWQPTQGALVGRPTLMAADEWETSRATGVRIGRMQGLSRWGLIWPLPTPPLYKAAPLTMGQTNNRLSISNDTK
ncbi:hypothetical protein Q8A73_006995 [Channa argus]|nr:hypothetical protein Q8A73_006995 [Channa argus]